MNKHRRDDLVAVHLSRMINSDLFDEAMKRDIRQWFSTQEPVLDHNGMVEILADEYHKAGHDGLIPLLRAGKAGAANLNAMARVRDAVGPGDRIVEYVTQVQSIKRDTHKETGWTSCCCGHETMEAAISCNEQTAAFLKTHLETYYAGYDLFVRIARVTRTRLEEIMEEERPIA